MFPKYADPRSAGPSSAGPGSADQSSAGTAGADGADTPDGAAGVIAADWIEPRGGAERVLEQMQAVFPSADLVALWNDDPARFTTTAESWLARTPLRRSKALSLPLMPAAWRSLDLRGAEWVLASSCAFAHHAGAVGDAKRFVYAHTPARYLWAPEQDPRGRSIGAHLAGPALRRLDRSAVGPGVSYAANSSYIRDRIATAWQQDAVVIPPPVDVERVRRSTPLGVADQHVLDGLPQDFLLGASRCVAYKRLDRVIETGERLDLPVVLAGDGPLRAELEDRAAAASVPVHVLIAPSDGLLAAVFARATTYVFPAVEDFGIMPVEAMAAGTPVVVQAVGGAREGVDRVGGGVVAECSDPVALAHAADLASRLTMADVPARVDEEFGVEAFRMRLVQWMRDGGVPVRAGELRSAAA